MKLHLLNKTGGNFCVLQEVRPVWLQLVSYTVQIRYFNYSSLVTTMEDYSGSGLLVNGSSSSCADGSEIPVGTKAFAPFILLEILVAFASNTILTALIIKARRVQNNTNIYLFSLSTAGLMEGLVTVIAGKWVLG